MTATSSGRRQFDCLDFPRVRGEADDELMVTGRVSRAAPTFLVTATPVRRQHGVAQRLARFCSADRTLTGMNSADIDHVVAVTDRGYTLGRPPQLKHWNLRLSHS